MLAHQLSINGFVYNDSSGVYVEAQSDVETLQLFVDSIQEEQPSIMPYNTCGHYKAGSR